ncbi:MAG: hypothetical protein ACLRT4_15870 [Thomasclavelia sp.]
MNTMDKVLVTKELKLIFENKKILIYIILGILFPVTMEFVFTKFTPIIPIYQAIPLILLFVTMLSSEFLYLNFTDEIEYGSLDIMLISPIAKSKIFFLKSFCPLMITIFIVLISAIVHDGFVYAFNIISIEIFNYSNLLMMLVAIIFSLFGEWLCLLLISEYNNNNHTIAMIITYVIVIGLFYLQNHLHLFWFTMIVLVSICGYYAIILKFLKLKDKNSVNKLYLKNCFANKKISFFKAEFLRILCELRKIRYLYLKTAILFIMPILYLSKFPNNLWGLWMVLFIIISIFSNKIVFSAYFSDISNKIYIVRYVANQKSKRYFNVNILLLGLILTAIIILDLKLGQLLLSIVITSKLYFLLVVSVLVNLLICLLSLNLINNSKDYKIINFIYSIISFLIHYIIFIY